ncbi:NUDIX domain-containing protein [Humitalea rosea]|uniref:NUDIX domain-containing protein n=1 Tax=Humitalea rosea TaxID=990373 RepID=A0A2W7IMV3_9PROT|nr:NUDIX hydrolase [Humitalea rosea]PZW48656.1 NUDIX domain-containing protein [Humitalea rosea]
MSADAPGWDLVSERSLVRDRWIDLRAQCCRAPDGAVLDPYYVQLYPDWVHVVALTADDRLVLVRQWRQGIGAWVTELPGGVIDPGEDPVTAGMRELREETGFGAAGARHIAARSPEPAKFNNRVHTVIALDAEVVAAPHREPGETMSVLLRPVAEVLAEMGEGGGIGHATHVAGLYTALLALGRLGLR